MLVHLYIFGFPLLGSSVSIRRASEGCPYTDEVYTELEIPLSDDEVKLAMKNLPSGKAASIDGIPYELWKKLHERYKAAQQQDKPGFNILDLLRRVFNSVEDNGIEPCTNFNKGWMCPLYKKNDRTEISNYRPITVLNTDYRIMTRALTYCLAKAAPDIIHPDQAGFMRGR